MQANLGPVAEAPPQGSPRLSCLQPVPKRVMEISPWVAVPIAPTLSFSLACCSLSVTQLQLPGASRRGR